MPRAFDSDRHEGPLRFFENVDCPACDEVFEGEFVDVANSMTVEDMTDPPSGIHECPDCGHQFTSQATGWAFFSEAG